MTRYEQLTGNCEERIETLPNINQQLLAQGNIAKVAQNMRSIVEHQINLGLLHWRHGLDPRPDFQAAQKTYQNITDILAEHDLRPANAGALEIFYIAMAAMGETYTPKFLYLDTPNRRWPLYRNHLIHLLHEERMGPELEKDLPKNLKKSGLVDQIYTTFFQLLGDIPTDLSQDELVKQAEINWTNRRTNRWFSDSDSYEGSGDFNDLYVDIQLAAVLRKVGWQGESIHKWQWD